jgi:hypothetical protein
MSLNADGYLRMTASIDLDGMSFLFSISLAYS